MLAKPDYLRQLFVAACCCALGLAVGSKLASAADEPDVYTLQLAKYDIQPTAESIADYLQSLLPTADHQRAMQKLIHQLGDESYAQRESATRQLMQQPAGLTELLAAAVAGPDPEIRWRAQLISDQTSRESQALLHAVLSTVQRQKFPELTAPLLKVTGLCTAEPLRTALRRAVAATLSPADVPHLLAALKSSSAEQRSLAAATLPLASPAAADEHLPALLRDDVAAVQLAAARSLANRGRRETLPVLVDLLNSNELPIRVEAFRTLKAVTGQSLPFVVYDTPEKRTEQRMAWQAWVDIAGQTAELKFPLRESTVELGRLLVCDQQQNQLIEYDEQGKEIWKKSTPAQPWGCQGLENGHRLVCCFAERIVVEYDAQGAEIWRATGLPGGPTSVQRLENGNTLLACTEASEVVEVDRAGKITWRAKIDGRPVDARRLEDGRTLVSLQNLQKVVELDISGKNVWELSGVGNVFSAQRLESGNTLVCTVGHSQVREFDRGGKVVWSQGKFLTPYTAQRLSNGNTMVVDRKGVHEINPVGEVVNHIVTPRISRAHKY
ncbi:HEAT repeat protein [Anatilimnocola aggregata]|uniref:HEAT repeat protein n=1 Tax=Anatilimnocola aggregata TaxID=2528021 RepID=A0A517YL66_9BACT|nr:PQQ-binding-like beta-propeller repeat protein [Anatilimnocola aggregata]QDU30971.1 HEAT repeat protein [Anatilimnocola aggregata]